MNGLPANPFAPVSTPEPQVADALVRPTAQQEDTAVELSLRPTSLQEFIGQAQLKENLAIFIEAATQRNEALDHVLLYGNPGLGKTTLAHIIASEAGHPIRVTSGPALERVADLAAILTNLQAGDVLFIDEIHRMNKAIEEVLYPAMEDFALDLVVGKGPTARTVRLELERFTIIGATTRMSLLSSPLRDRFGAVHHLSFYEPEELEAIVQRSAALLGVPMDMQAASLIASRCRRTPRIANRLIKRVRDFAQVKHGGTITVPVANEALSNLHIDEHGLDRIDRHILHTIVETFQGGPVGLSALAAATAEEEQTIEDVYEPYLMQLGFLNRTPRGRTVTERGRAVLDAPNL